MNKKRLNKTALQGNGRNKEMTEQIKNRFCDLGITSSLLKGLDRLHHKFPTPIQDAAIPAGIQGNDIIAIAQTGSGKTAAFGIPMMQRLLKMKTGAGLILVPTRELAIQVKEALQDISGAVQLRSTVLIGGAPFSMQRVALKKRPRIIVATPGRLMDHIRRRTIKLDNIEIFVLDEADRMLDMGFIHDIEMIMESIPDNRQTMLFSATMPREIQNIANKLMEDPIQIEVNRSGEAPAKVSHEMFIVSNQNKSRLLAVQLKKRTGPVLVFTRTKRIASRLNAKVKDMGFDAAEIHSDRSLSQRRRALEGFKRGNYRVLIATDIAARGIDVSDIELVVNYDMPANSEDYVHRIGRTGRAGKAGHAISFATDQQKGFVRDIERFMKSKLSVSALPTLPSQEFPLKSSNQFDMNNESSREKRPSQGNFTKFYSSKDQNAHTRGSKKRSAKRTGFKNKDFKRKNRNENLGHRKVHKDGTQIYTKVLIND